MKKTFSFRPRSEVFEQYKGVGGHFGHICYTHILYISASRATPRGTLLTIARRTARFRRPVLHVQVGNRREKTFGQQAGLLRACESHAVRSAKTQECTRTLHRGEHAHTVYAHHLYSVRLPAQLAHMPHAALCCLLAPAKPARQDTRRGAVCRAKRQPPEHYWSCGLWLTPACVRHLAGKHVALLTSAVLLKNNTAGLATALRGDRRLCRQTPAAAAGRQQPQLDVVRQMPFLQHLQGA